MAQRIIKASFTAGTSADLKGGSFATLGSITSDSGAVAYGQITSVTLKLTAIRCYATNFYLKLISGTVSTGAVLGQTGNIAADSTIHESTFTLSGPAASLLTGSFSGFMLGVVATSGTGNKINFRDNCEAEITINYTPVTAPTPPTSVSVNSTNVKPSTNVTLSWSGASDGSLNVINGYEIWRSTSASGTYTKLTSVAKGTTTATVTSPSSPGSYYYKILPIATNTAVPSTLSSAYATLTTAITAPGAPTSVSVASTNVAPGATVKLSWSGATNGTNNPITGYEVWRSTTASGTYEKIATLGNVSNTNVTAPSNNGSYYYKIKPIATESGYPGSLSSQYATLTTSVSSPSAPSTLSLASNNVAPNTSVKLSWSGASGGTNNPITGYEVYRDTSSYGSFTEKVATVGNVLYTNVTSPAAPGTYYYKVKPIATYSVASGSLSSNAAALTTAVTAPSAPTGVSVSSNNVAPSASVKLSWSGATDGTNNPINGYEIWRCTTASGTYAKIASVGKTVTNTNVTAPASPGSYYYKILPVATNTSYPGSLSTNYATLTTALTATTAPSSLALSKNSTAPGETVTLSWAGAQAGTNNPITGYEVYRATSSTGTYTKLGNTLTATQTTVQAPSTNGSKFYYKIVTVGSYSGYSSEKSSAIELACNVSDCQAPSTLELDYETVSPGTRVNLSWSEAQEGTNNPITGYDIYRSTVRASGYTLLQSISTTSTSGTVAVTAPTSDGAIYYYKIVTKGTLSGYDSNLSTAYAALECDYESVGEPTNVNISVTNAAPSQEVILSWSGATDGTNNPIKGYKIYRATAEDGEYTVLDTLTTSDTAGSLTVIAPATNGAKYWYKIQTLGTISGSDSALTNDSIALMCTFSAPSAPGNVRLNGQEITYAEPQDTQMLTWSASSPGANNPLTGYRVYRDNAIYQDNISIDTLSLEVPVQDTPGHSYTYQVMALGTYSNSARSASVTVRTYSNPTAPTSVIISESEVAAGERATLSWSGAVPGGYNDILGYKVYRSESIIDNYILVASTTGQALSLMVEAPPKKGETYYFRVMTIGSYSQSVLSDGYVSLSAVADPPAVSEAFDAVIEPLPPQKRGFIFGDYVTGAHGWTLTAWEFSSPETQTRYVDVPFRMDGPLDLSTGMTDGDPRYGSREFNATFELSEGSRMDREAVISEFINLLHGRSVEIVFPDAPDHYAVGRLHINKLYNDPAHASVEVSAVCQPWLFSKQETVNEYIVSEDPQMIVLSNRGRKKVVPEITVTGFQASVTIAKGVEEWVLPAGTHLVPSMALQTGNTILMIHGVGTMAIKYREAIL